MKRCIVILFCLIQVFAGWGSSFLAGNYYMLSYLTIANGLPSNSVEDIMQDSYGFVWMCTHDGGVVRYDGYDYHRFGVGSTAMPLLSNSSRHITEDAHRRLWISFDEGTQVLDLQTLLPVVPKAVNGKLDAKLKSVLAEQGDNVLAGDNGEMWVLTRAHIYNIGMDADGKVSRISGIAVTPNPNGGCLRRLDGGGEVYASYASSLWRLKFGGGKLHTSNLASRYPVIANRLVNDVASYRGKVYFATANGLFRGDGKAWHAGQHGSFLPHDMVSCILATSQGKLFIGTLGGVAILEGDELHAKIWTMQDKTNPLSSNFVKCIEYTKDVIWVGTEAGGVVKAFPRQLVLTNYVHGDSPASLSPNAVNAIYTEYNGTLWVGTVEGGLNRKAPGDIAFTHYTTANSALPHNSVSVLAADEYKRLWIGTWGGGLSYVSLDHPGEIHRLTVDSEHQGHLLFVGALMYDSHNKGLWVGTNDGLFFYSYKRQRMEDPFQGCRDIRGCIASTITADGRLWMGCIDGLVAVDLFATKNGHRHYDVQRWRHKLDDPRSAALEKIIALCPAKDGTLWLGSRGYGLYHMLNDTQGRDSFVNYSQRDGLANNVVRGIAEDVKGRLWITTDNGLSVMQPHTGLFSNFGESEGLVSSQFYFNSALVAANGNIYLGSEKGLTEVTQLNSTAENQGVLRFTGLVVGSQEVMANSDYLDEDISHAKKVKLHEADRSITIKFSALNYGAEKMGNYFCRMRGYEKEWMALPPGEHSVRYSGLPAGRYVFEVRYVSDISDKASQTVSVDVVVSPYFWKSWWFILLIVVSFAAAAYWLYAFRVRKLHVEEVLRLYQPIADALRESPNPVMLQSRIQNIIHNSRLFNVSAEKRGQVEMEGKKRQEHKFIQMALKVMEENYSNSDFGVTELCEALNMSRGVVNKKLKEETGVASSQFIRNYRLEVAHRRILNKDKNINVSELAYDVGFNDPKYFTRCFTKYYGVAPSEMMNEN
jgi:ligand-binding sensor domain-containing protein/AraC-like DNA-binding protein